MRLGDGAFEAFGACAASVIGVWGGMVVGRKRERVAIVQAIQQAAHLAIKDLTALADTLRGELERVTAKCDEVERNHARCEHDMAALRREITDLMAGPIASYPHRRSDTD